MPIWDRYSLNDTTWYRFNNSPLMDVADDVAPPADRFRFFCRGMAAARRSGARRRRGRRASFVGRVRGAAASARRRVFGFGFLRLCKICVFYS